MKWHDFPAWSESSSIICDFGEGACLHVDARVGRTNARVLVWPSIHHELNLGPRLPLVDGEALKLLPCCPFMRRTTGSLFWPILWH